MSWGKSRFTEDAAFKLVVRLLHTQANIRQESELHPASHRQESRKRPRDPQTRVGGVREIRNLLQFEPLACPYGLVQPERFGV